METTNPKPHKADSTGLARQTYYGTRPNLMVLPPNSRPSLTMDLTDRDKMASWYSFAPSL